jgi:uncharacterized protein
MTISMYQASAPRLANGLKNLAAMLSKAEAHAVEKGFDPAVLLQSRLYPDMFPLCRQVQIACDNAKGPVARLAGRDAPVHADTETTFEQLQARIAKTLDFIASVPAAEIDGSEERTITLKLGPRGDVSFAGMQYLCGFALPNFYFHVSTAYAILRHNGIAVGKADYIGVP